MCLNYTISHCYNEEEKEEEEGEEEDGKLPLWSECFIILDVSIFRNVMGKEMSYFKGKGRGKNIFLSQHYLPLDGMINIPIYLVWGFWVQLDSAQFFADHIRFNNGYMKHAHTWKTMTNNNTNNKRKQV